MTSQLSNSATAASPPQAALRHPSFVIPLWAWVAAGFLFLATLWTAMFFYAGQANVQSVPLNTPGAMRP